MNKLKEMAVIIICLVPLLILTAILNPSFFFPIPAYYAAGFTMMMAGWLFAFANFDFAHVQKHARPWISAGSAETVQQVYYQLNKFRLGVDGPNTREITVNLKKLPKSIHFLGRWTVYLSEEDQLELWHDHHAFGSRWYYIQY